MKETLSGYNSMGSEGYSKHVLWLDIENLFFFSTNERLLQAFPNFIKNSVAYMEAKDKEKEKAA